jgi:hypothetical protein
MSHRNSYAYKKLETVVTKVPVTTTIRITQYAYVSLPMSFYCVYSLHLYRFFK